MAVRPRLSVRLFKQMQGLTLLELVLVLLVLGLAYALSGPLLTDGNIGLDSRAATRQMAAGLRKARSIAVTEGRETILTLDVENRTFSVSGDKRGYQLPRRVDLSMFTAQQELVDDRMAGIRFLPDGSSTGGRITIVAGDLQHVLDVDWLTGRVTIR